MNLSPQEKATAWKTLDAMSGALNILLPRKTLVVTGGGAKRTFPQSVSFVLRRNHVNWMFAQTHPNLSHQAKTAQMQGTAALNPLKRQRVEKLVCG